RFAMSSWGAEMTGLVLGYRNRRDHAAGHSDAGSGAVGGGAHESGVLGQRAAGGGGGRSGPGLAALAENSVGDLEAQFAVVHVEGDAVAFLHQRDGAAG